MLKPKKIINFNFFFKFKISYFINVLKFNYTSFVFTFNGLNINVTVL